MNNNKKIMHRNTKAINNYFDSCGMIEADMDAFMFELLALFTRSTAEQNLDPECIEDNVTKIEILKGLISSIKPVPA